MRPAKRTVMMLSDNEEARLQEQIAKNPDAAEASDAQLAAARPASEVLPPSLYAALTRPRGRPKLDDPKLPVKLRLDRATVETFRATGDGWQTRMNDVLAVEAKKLRKKASRAGSPKG